MLKVYIKYISVYWNWGWYFMQALLTSVGSRPLRCASVWRTRKVPGMFKESNHFSNVPSRCVA
jgi:hypothetical protein